MALGATSTTISASANIDASQSQPSRNRKKKAWTKVSSASSYLQFEYSDPLANGLHGHGHGHRNGSGSGARNASIDDMANYALGAGDDEHDDVYDGDMESMIGSGHISHASTKNLRQLTRNAIYKDAAVDIRFRPQSKKHRSPQQSQPQQQQPKWPSSSSASYRRRYNKYNITDIFASNSSFVLDHEYSNDDICQLILGNSSQTQTKIKFLKSIWPHILRVTTRVLTGSKFRCPICLDTDISVGRITECGHCFCGVCLLHHLFAHQNGKKVEKEQRLFPEVKDNTYDFSHLYGHCPLCHEYVTFENTRPLTVIRVQEYKVGDVVDMVLVERHRGEQPQFTTDHVPELNISTFRKFETETTELEECQTELDGIVRSTKSADPLYEEPYLRLLAVQVEQFQTYIAEQRAQHPATKTEEISEEKSAIATNLKQKQFPILATRTPMPSSSEQQQQQQAQQQHRFRKKKYVYQVTDGQLIFLNPHNYNMLKHDINFEFGAFPVLLQQCQVLDIERMTQSYDVRRRYPFLGFIPNDVAFSMVECDLSHIVSADTLRYFEKSIVNREQNRAEQQKLAQQEVQRQQIMEQQRVAMRRQQYVRPSVDIKDKIEFPSLQNETNASNSDHSDTGNVDNNGNRKSSSPLHRSWSEMMASPKQTQARPKIIDSPPSNAVNDSNVNVSPINNSNAANMPGAEDGVGIKKKRRRGRSKKNKT